MFFDTRWNDENETFGMEVKAGFAKPIAPNQIIHVMSIILDATHSKVGARLCEGLSMVSIDENGIKLRFYFSSNEEHIARVEAQIGRKELHSHRVNFIFYVFAKVDEIYKLDDSLPPGFQQNLDMPSYIK